MTVKLVAGLLLVKALTASPLPMPSPQLIVKSQSNLFREQPGRQVDLSQVLPTKELFWLNLEEGYFACQLNKSEQFLKIFRLSRLCDQRPDCFKGSDELEKDLRCSSDCNPPCLNGVCLSSRPESQCHCDDGWGGVLCEEPDLNECKYRPCSLFAHCTNTLGSFYCTCRPGYVGDGLECRPEQDLYDTDGPDYDGLEAEEGEEEDEFSESNGLQRSSICTYNGVEYREREEVFTGRRCNKCWCSNGEIRCKEELCPSPGPGCQSIPSPGRCCPDIVCPQGAINGGGLQPREEDGIESVVQNVRDLIGGLSGAGGMLLSTEPTLVTDGSLVTLPWPVRDLGENTQSGDNGSKATVEPLWNVVLNGGDEAAPASPPPPASPPGLVVLNLTPSPNAGSATGFRPLTNTTTTTTTESSISDGMLVTTDRHQVVIEEEEAAIEINFTNKEDTRDTVTVKFTFEDEKANEVEDDIEDGNVLLYDEENEDDREENVFLYDIVTDSPRTARPPLFDSLPMFEKDIFSSTFYQDGEEETTVGPSSDLFTSTQVSTSAEEEVTSTPLEESGSMDRPTDEDSSNNGLIFPDPSINLVEQPGSLLPGLKDPTRPNNEKDDPPLRPVAGNVRPAQPRSEEESSNVLFPDVNLVPLDGDNVDGDQQKVDRDDTTVVSGVAQYATSTDPSSQFDSTTEYRQEYTPEDNTEYSLEDAGGYGTTKEPSDVTAGSTKYGSTLPEVEVTDYPSTLQDSGEWEEKASNSAAIREAETATETIPTINYIQTTTAAIETATSITESISTTLNPPESLTESIIATESGGIDMIGITESAVSTEGAEAEVSTVRSITEETSEEGEEEKSVEAGSRPAQPRSEEGKTSRPPTSPVSNAPQLDSGSTPSDPLLPLAPLPCPSPAFLCQDGTTCLQPNKVCDGFEDCPLHEVGLGGEDEDGCEAEESSGEMVDDENSLEEEMLGGRKEVEEEESNIESPGRESADPIREPVVGGTTATAVDADVTQVSPASTSGQPNDQNNNKPAVMEESDPNIREPVVDGGSGATDVTQVSPTSTSGRPNDQNNNKPALTEGDGGLTTKSTPHDVTQVSRETTSVKPTEKSNDGKTQSTTSSSEKATQSESGVNVNVNVNVNVGGVGIGGEVRPRSEEGLYGDCTSLNMPSTFSSFSGAEASNMADCSWDFFACTEKYGRWPDNRYCCEERFHSCSSEVQPTSEGVITRDDCRNHNHSHTHLCPKQWQDNTDKVSTDNVNKNININFTGKEESQGRGKESRREEQGELLACIWAYTSCSSSPRVAESGCRKEFTSCASSAPFVGGDPTALGGLEDGGNGFTSCLLQLYSCSKSKSHCLLRLNTCEQLLSDDQDLASSSSVSRSSAGALADESGDSKTPSLAEGAGKVPEIQCTWSFFQCNLDPETCKQRHSDCLAGNHYDNKICSAVARNPTEYLVPHPTDCTKFYSCQKLGWGGWKANLMDCPMTTGFDTALKVCNYAASLPRCKAEGNSLLVDPGQLSIVARRARQSLLDVQVSGPAFYSQLLSSSSLPSLSFSLLTVPLILLLR